MKKILLVFAVLIALSFSANAQQDARYTQYMFNKLAFNPGYAGTADGLSLSGLYRIQWVNIDGAPTSFTLSGHTPLGAAKKIGVGAFLEHDQIGVHKETSIFLSYSYKFAIGDRSKLSVGVNGGAAFLNSDFQSIMANGGNEWIDLTVDGAFMENVNKVLPNFGVGLYYYTPNKYYVGLSAPFLLENSLGGPRKVAKQARHYYLTGGFVMPLGDNLKLKPSMLVKMVPNRAPIQFDANVMFLIKDALWLGTSFRIDDQINSESLDFIAAFQMKNGMRIGYAYDLTLSDLSSYTSGSHEIMLGYDFLGKDKRIVTPRYF